MPFLVINLNSSELGTRSGDLYFVPNQKTQSKQSDAEIRYKASCGVWIVPKCAEKRIWAGLILGIKISGIATCT